MVGCSFACLEGGITVACLRHTLSTECALARFYADLCYSRGLQPFSDHVPLQHFDRWTCTPTISYDKYFSM